VFFDDAKINDTNATGHRLVGKYDSSVDIVGMQVMWQMR
jgi:hypothetical protein